MLNLQKQSESLQTKRVRHAFSMKASAAVMCFFTAAWCLLQWSLSSAELYSTAGTPRDFALLEALASLVIAACALAHLLVSASAWAVIALRMRSLPSGADSVYPAGKRNSRRFAILG